VDRGGQGSDRRRDSLRNIVAAMKLSYDGKDL
jgi:hypothetical protein